jgi:hypothetical protein
VTNANHTGDATGATALTLATVNANVGPFGSATQVATFTVNAKGLTTAAGVTAIAVPSTAVTDFNAASRAQTEAELIAGANVTITPAGSGATRTLTIAASGGGGATNLSYTAATRVIASDTGTDATLPLVTSGDAGLAPASGGGTTNFLRADGTWAAAGGGSPVTVQDEGANITTALGTLNFVGAGVTVTGGATATVTIPSGGGGSYQSPLFGWLA